MINQNKVIQKLILAREIADKKWGKESGNLVWNDNPHLGLTILVEEVGEVARAILENDLDSLYSELLDTGQVIIAWLEALPDGL